MITNKLFTTEQEELGNECWRLMLRQKSEEEIYKERQKEIIRGIFG
jgi:hypothetical protein